MQEQRQNTIGDVQRCASEYSQRYGGIELDWSDLWDLLNDYNTAWPHNALPGCYAIFDENMDLLYVGKASVSIGSRLNSYFRYDPNSTDRKRGIARFPDSWPDKQPRYIACVAVKETWEASSLEEYLIHQLRPRANTVGKR